MVRSVEKIFETIKSELLEMVLEEDRFQFFPPLRTLLDMELEEDIYDLMNLAKSEKEARNYLKQVVEFAGEYYESGPEIIGEYYPEYYVKYFKRMNK